MGFERVDGPVGPAWRDEADAAIHEQLQRLNHIQGAAHFTDRKHKKNPVPKPKHYPRPWELIKPEEDQYDPEEDQMDMGPDDTFGSGDEEADGGDDHSDGLPDQ